MFRWKSIIKNGSTRLNGAVVIGSLFGLLMFPSLAEALPVTVQTLGNKSNAAPGESGATIPSSALISVVVTNSNGVPNNQLGASVGNGNAAIALPNGWSLQTGFNVPPGGCGMTPTEFFNSGNGIYSIRVVPFVNNAACRWLAGDYHYAIQLNVPGSGGRTFIGSGLGVLKLP